MLVQYCSDLHLEFPENRIYLKDNAIQPVGDIMLLAGDIVPFSLLAKHTDFFDFISDHFETAYWIPGNHEYYHSDIAGRSGVFHEKIRSNLHLVNNQIIRHGTVRFVFTTLWSHIGPIHQHVIQQGMADFHVIRANEGPFTPSYYNQLHEDSKNFLEQLLPDENGQTVAVTHHVPTFINYPEKYRGDAFNEAFATELSDLIIPIDADYWIYGHHHQPISEFKIGNTRLVTNQLGYVRYNEHKSFRRNAILTL